MPGHQVLDHVDQDLQLGREYDCSDIHLPTAFPPAWRRFGQLSPIWEDHPLLTAQDTERLAQSFLGTKEWNRLQEKGDVDFAYANDHGRYRASVVKQRLGYDMAFRVINTKIRTMEEIGLPLEHLVPLTRYQNGLILVTGSVGSGKSTTLASLVDFVNQDREDHILTLEDPIEYVFESKGCHVNQREVHSHTESFAKALRGALREDPDVIMVGEIRDLETADISIKAAQTGHMVLSTLHTNDAPTTLTRLMNMGVAPFNIASSVILITAQRLARRLCTCKQPLDIDEYGLLQVGYREDDLDGSWVPFRPVGCERCKGSGYKGRVGIYQVMPISEEIQRIILSNGNAMQIAEQARREGVNDLRRSGLIKVRQGLTSIEEVLGVTNE